VIIEYRVPEFLCCRMIRVHSSGVEIQRGSREPFLDTEKGGRETQIIRKHRNSGTLNFTVFETNILKGLSHEVDLSFDDM